MPWFTCIKCHHPFWRHDIFGCSALALCVHSHHAYTECGYCQCTYTMEEQRQFGNELPDDEFEILHESYGGSTDAK